MIGFQGDVERCLVVAPGMLVEQWAKRPRRAFPSPSESGLGACTGFLPGKNRTPRFPGRAGPRKNDWSQPRKRNSAIEAGTSRSRHRRRSALGDNGLPLP